MPAEEESNSHVSKEVEKEEVADTVWLKPEITGYNEWDWKLDTAFMRNDQRIQLSMSIHNLKQQFEHKVSWVKNDSIFAQQLKGPQFEFKVVAKTDNDKTLLSKVFGKEDLITENYANFLVADSYTQFKFLGYHDKFKAFLLQTFMGYPATDHGVLQYIFIGLDGKVKKQITEGTPYEICDTDPYPSPDGKIFSFCKGILHTDYRLVPVDRETPLAGIFQLGNKHNVAVYMFEGKPPYSNMKVLGSNGSLQKSFPFEGIVQEMSYSVLHCRLANGKLVMFDYAQRLLFVFNPDTPTSPEIIRFDDIKTPTELVKAEGESFKLWSYTGEYQLYYMDDVFYLAE